MSRDRSDDVYLPTVRVKQSAYSPDDLEFLRQTEEGYTPSVDFDKTRHAITEHLTMTIQLVPHKVLKRQFNYLVLMIFCLLAIMIGLSLVIIHHLDAQSALVSVSPDRCNLILHYFNGATQQFGPICK